MHSRPVVAFAVACLLLPGTAAPDGGPNDVNEAFNAAFQEYSAADSVEAKLSIVKKFLAAYPESPHTLKAIGRVAQHQGVELADLPGATAYVEAIRSKVSDAGIALALDLKLAGLYGRGRRSAEFEALALRLAASDQLSFAQHVELIEQAVELPSWDVIEASCGKAIRFATADTFRADYPNLDYSAAELEAAARNRRGILLTYQGWSKAQLGQVEEGLADLEMADGLLRKNVLGLTDGPVNLYWGRALMTQGRYEEASDRLAPDALFLGDEEALAALEDCYRALGGEKSGFDSYARVKQLRLATTLDDFTLPGFAGGEHRLHDLKGTVTLVSFWHPT